MVEDKCLALQSAERKLLKGVFCQNEALAPSWRWSNSWRTGFFFSLTLLIFHRLSTSLKMRNSWMESQQDVYVCACYPAALYYVAPSPWGWKCGHTCGGLFNISSPSSVCVCMCGCMCHRVIYSVWWLHLMHLSLYWLLLGRAHLCTLTFKTWSLSDTAGVVATETGPSNICLTPDPTIITLFHIVIYL